MKTKIEKVVFSVAHCGCVKVDSKCSDTALLWAGLAALRMLSTTPHGLELLERLGLGIENLNFMKDEASEALAAPPCTNPLNLR